MTVLRFNSVDQIYFDWLGQRIMNRAVIVSDLFQLASPKMGRL